MFSGAVRGGEGTAVAISTSADGFTASAKRVGHSVFGNNNSLSSSGRTTSKMQLYISRIDQNPFRIWFSPLGPIDLNVKAYYSTYPFNKREHSETTKIWSFDFDCYAQFVADMKSKFPHIEVVEIPRSLTVGLLKYANCIRVALIAEPNLCPYLTSQLKPYQLEAIQYVISRNGRALLAHEPGCGECLYLCLNIVIIFNRL